MKIYLGFTVAGDRSSLEAAKKILGALQSMGHEVLTSHLVREDAWDAGRRVAPQEIFARDMAWLAQCDLFAAEVSGSSFGLGFETGYLLGASRGRPFSSTNEARSAVRINRSRHREEPLTSPTGFARPTLPVEEGCWWLPVLQNGEDCLGTAAFRPNQFSYVFAEVVRRILEDAASGRRAGT